VNEEELLEKLNTEIGSEVLQCLSYFDIKDPDQKTMIEFACGAGFLLGAKRVIPLKVKTCTFVSMQIERCT
jgi:hypothetical protein